MLKIAISLFLSGIFLGAGPCLASCGPLLISYIAANAKSRPQALWYWFVFSIARIFVYVIFGVLLGLFGEFFLRHMYPTHVGKYILISGAVFIVAVGIAMLLKKGSQPKICSSNSSIFVFGLTLGVMPCGPLLGILSTVGLMSRNIFDGIFFSLAFGLGTMISPLLPLALGAGSLQKFLTHEKARIIFNRICAIIIIALGIFILLTRCSFADEAIRAKGIANFHKVDEGFYRGAHPTEEGLYYLKQIGVKTIIDFRDSKVAVGKEKKAAERLGIKFINIPFGFFKTPPKDEVIKRFLDIVSDPKNRPVFIHCHSGRDRTGMMAATYRIAAQGWPEEKAYKEAKDLGFHFFYWPMRNFILKKAEKFKRQVKRGQAPF